MDVKIQKIHMTKNNVWQKLKLRKYFFYIIIIFYFLATVFLFFKHKNIVLIGCLSSNYSSISLTELSGIAPTDGAKIGALLLYTHFQSFLFDFNSSCRDVNNNNKPRILSPYAKQLWSPDFFFRLLLSNCLSWKINCDHHPSLSQTAFVC